MHTHYSHAHLLVTHPLVQDASYKLTHSPTHTCTQQVQADSAQYLGGYSGEGGALRDVFGYLQSLYPQGSKHQLLLGRTHEGQISGVREEGGGPRMREQRENI